MGIPPTVDTCPRFTFDFESCDPYYPFKYCLKNIFKLREPIQEYCNMTRFMLSPEKTKIPRIFPQPEIGKNDENYIANNMEHT